MREQQKAFLDLQQINKGYNYLALVYILRHICILLQLWLSAKNGAGKKSWCEPNSGFIVATSNTVSAFSKITCVSLDPQH